MANELTPEYLDRLSQAIASAHSLFDVLSRDVERHVTRTTVDDMELAVAAESDPLTEIQQSRRDYVRACFAFVEALCFSMKLLSQQSLNELQLEDKLLCKEQDFDIDGRGKVAIKKRKISFLSNLRYSFDVFCRSFGIANTCDYADNGFRELQNSVAVRDRLMHPKETQDLFITSGELLSMANGFTWFASQHRAIVYAGLNSVTTQFESSAERK